MANTTITPTMNLPVGVPGTDPAPDWANNIVADMYAIDSHNHSAGQGVQISPSGLNINADLPMNGNNLTTIRTTRFSSQGAPLSAGSDIGCLYEVGVDLYYNDGAGNQVRITQGGSVTGSSGTITGLPSGTASASFAGGTFTFQSATNTPATMNIGPIVNGRARASSHTVTIQPNSAIAADYNLNWPAAAPDTNQVLVSDNSGNFSWAYAQVGQLPLGSVIATFPNLTGAYSCAATTAADAAGFVKCNGQTISDATSPMNGQVVPNINNTVFLAGSTTAGSTGGAASVSLSSANLAAHTHAFTSDTSVATSGHTHNFAHTHQWLETTTAASVFSYGLTTLSNSTTNISTSSVHFFESSSSDISTGAGNAAVKNQLSGLQAWYTTGAIAAPSGSGASASTDVPSGTTTVSGTTNSTGSGTSFSILPTYITTLYIMRIK